MVQPCDTCGDSYIMALAGRKAARDSAKKQADETKEPFCVCEEAGNYFASSFRTATENRFKIIEVVSGLQATT